MEPTDSCAEFCAIGYWSLAIEVAANLAWPLLVLTICLYFSSEIKGALGRVLSFGRDGFQFVPPPQVSATAEYKGREGEEPSAEIDLDDPVALRLLGSIQEALEKVPDEEKQGVLLKALTIERLHKSFAIAYSGMFGSQIGTLHHLNSRPISIEAAESEFRDLQERFEAFRRWDLNAYLSYLKSWELIEVANEQISLTETGRNFIRFMIEARLSHNRPL